MKCGGGGEHFLKKYHSVNHLNLSKKTKGTKINLKKFLNNFKKIIFVLEKDFVSKLIIKYLIDFNLHTKLQNNFYFNRTYYALNYLFYGRVG